MTLNSKTKGWGESWAQKGKEGFFILDRSRCRDTNRNDILVKTSVWVSLRVWFMNKKQSQKSNTFVQKTPTHLCLQMLFISTCLTWTTAEVGIVSILSICLKEVYAKLFLFIKLYFCLQMQCYHLSAHQKAKETNSYRIVWNEQNRARKLPISR